jgi:predicted nucleic-acid-binding Zn-ribbon protein
MDEEKIKCPKCGSTQIIADKKDFDLGSALATGYFLGPAFGILAGINKSNKVEITCLKCGHTWEAGKPR